MPTALAAPQTLTFRQRIAPPESDLCLIEVFDAAGVASMCHVDLSCEPYPGCYIVVTNGTRAREYAWSADVPMLASETYVGRSCAVTVVRP